MPEKLNTLISALFPGIRVTNITLSHGDGGDGTSATFTLKGGWDVITDPESLVDPRILRILKAEKSAEEMRKDKGDGE